MPRYVQLTGVVQRLAALTGASARAVDVAMSLGRHVVASRVFVFNVIVEVVMTVLGARVVSASLARWRRLFFVVSASRSVAVSTVRRLSRLVFPVAAARTVAVALARRASLVFQVSAVRTVAAGMRRRLRLVFPVSASRLVSSAMVRGRRFLFSVSGARTVSVSAVFTSSPIIDASSVAITDSSGAALTAVT
jgi:hypothetical protein